MAARFQTIEWAWSSVIGGLPQVVIEEGREVESIGGFHGSTVSAPRLLTASV